MAISYTNRRRNSNGCEDLNLHERYQKINSYPDSTVHFNGFSASGLFEAAELIRNMITNPQRRQPDQTHLKLLQMSGLSCRTLNVRSSLICSVGESWDRVDGGIAGTMGPSRCCRSNPFLSDTSLHFRFQNISRAPIQSIWCTCSSPLDL